MRIGELARRTGASVRSLRYYEQQEMLLSDRTSGGHRVYRPDAVDRVQLIRLMFEAGLPSSAVRQMLPCVYSGTTTPAMVRRLQDERRRLAECTDRLERAGARLDVLIEQANDRLAPAAVDGGSAA